MRSTDEIGGLKVSKEANEAYKTYASIYLDFVDDNPQHFFGREIDLSPIFSLEEKGIEETDENIRKSYLDAATGIAKVTISSGYWKSYEDLYDMYPLLRERSEELESIIYAEQQS